MNARSWLLTLSLLFAAHAAAQAPAGPLTPAAPSASPVAAPSSSTAPAPAASTTSRAAPASASGPSQTPAPPTPSAPIQPAPPRYRLLPPRLIPIAHPAPRRYGDAGAPFALGVGADLLWRRDSAYKLFTDSDPSVALDVFASYDVWSPFRRAIVAAGLSYRYQSLGPSHWQLKLHAVQAELTARYGVTSWLWPHLRVALGVATTRLQLRDLTAHLDYEDHAAGLASTFGGGVTFRTPARLFETWRGHLSSLSLGVLIEGGYIVEQSAKLDAKPAHTNDIARTSFPLGKLARNAPYLRMAGVVRF